MWVFERTFLPCFFLTLWSTLGEDKPGQTFSVWSVFVPLSIFLAYVLYFVFRSFDIEHLDQCCLCKTVYNFFFVLCAFFVDFQVIFNFKTDNVPPVWAPFCFRSFLFLFSIGFPLFLFMWMRNELFVFVKPSMPFLLYGRLRDDHMFQPCLKIIVLSPIVLKPASCNTVQRCFDVFFLLAHFLLLQARDVTYW